MDSYQIIKARKDEFKARIEELHRIWCETPCFSWGSLVKQTSTCQT